MKSLIAFWERRATGARVALVAAAFLLYGIVRGALIGAGVIDKPIEAAPPAPVAATAPSAPKAPSGELLVRQYLRRNLNDWDSYDNRGFSEAQPIAPHGGSPAWRIRHTYRAKNAFDATILNDQMFYYTADGVYEVLSAR